MMSKIEKLYEDQIESFRHTFSGLSYLSSTTDMWSVKNRSFIGVSIHYIDEITFKLKSNMIACEKFPGNHTAERVANKLIAIYDRLNIAEKIVATTTDNAGEFVAGFRDFGKNYDDFNEYKDNIAPTETIDNDSSIDDDDLCSNSEYDQIESCTQNENAVVESIEIFPIPTGEQLEDIRSDLDINLYETSSKKVDECCLLPLNDLVLPNRMDCLSHGLNIVATTHASKAMKNIPYTNKYFSALRKINRLWYLCNFRLPSEKMKAFLGFNIRKPNKIKWNYLYDNVSSIRNEISINMLFQLSIFCCLCLF